MNLISRYKKTIFIICIFVALISILMFSYSGDNSMEYYIVQDQFNKAVIEYTKENDEIAKDIFKGIISNDISNCYWESYVYLANIYIRLGFPDSAKYVIEQGLLNKDYCDLNAEKMLNVTKEAIKHDRYVELDSIETYEDLIEKMYPISLHIQCDKQPEPIDGYEKFKQDIIESLSKYSHNQNSKDRIYVTLAVNKIGDICRVEINSAGSITFNSDKLRKDVYKTKWKPAMLNNKPICWSIRVPIEFDNPKVPTSGRY